VARGAARPRSSMQHKSNKVGVDWMPAVFACAVLAVISVAQAAGKEVAARQNFEASLTYPAPPTLPQWAKRNQHDLAKETNRNAAKEEAAATQAAKDFDVHRQRDSVGVNTSGGAVAFFQETASEPEEEESEVNSRPLPSTIHTLPKIMPHRDYQERLKTIYREANEDSIIHQEKLEKQNTKLRKRVIILETALGDEQVSQISDELGAVVATASEFEQEQVRAVGLIALLLILGGIVISAQIISMLRHKSWTVQAKTWSAIGRILVVFVAVMWFHVLDDVFNWCGATLHQEAFFSTLHALILFAVLIVVAAKYETQRHVLDLLIACGMHYLSFMLVHAGGHVQAALFSRYWWLCFLGVFLLLAFFSGVSAVTRHLLLQRVHDDDESHFVESMEELEDDASGMMLAFVFTIMVRFGISGAFQLMQEGDTGVVITHTSWERFSLFLYAIGVTSAALFLLPRLNTLGERLQDSIGGYATQRVILILNPFLVMSSAWAFLLWADWEFYEYLFRGQRVLGRIVWSILCTIVCFAGIYVYALHGKRLPHPNRLSEDPMHGQSAKAMDLAWRWTDLEKRKFILNALAVLIAFSWGESFNVSIDGASTTILHPLWLNFILAAITTAMALPAYTFFVREMVTATEKMEDKELGLHIDS